MHVHRRIVIAAASTAVVAGVVAPALGSLGSHHSPSAKQHAARRSASRAAAAVDVQLLNSAATALQNQALSSQALNRPFTFHSPAKVIMQSVDALLDKARAQDPTHRVTSTVSFMGPVPHNLAHPLRHHQYHRNIRTTHTLSAPRRGVRIPSSGGVGMHHKHAGSWPALYQHANGVTVQPRLPVATHPTVASTALRAALSRLGQPYVWAGAGPTTFDCSGLTMWSYAHAGIKLTHYTGWQWNEGRKIPARDILPGDLILFGHPIHHVGMYLGAGWMVNAPYTGQYVDVVPVPSGVAGIIRP